MINYLTVQSIRGNVIILVVSMGIFLIGAGITGIQGARESDTLQTGISAQRMNAQAQQHSAPLAKALQTVPETVTKTGYAEPVAEKTRAKSSYSATTLLSLIMVACGLLSGLLMGFRIIRSVRRPTEELLDAADRLCAGELSARTSFSGRHELAGIGDAFNRIADTFQDLITKVCASVEEVASSATLLRTTSEMMASNAEEVANQTTTVAVASEEMAATSNDVAQNCSLAADGSHRANDSALTGSSVVQETISVMNTIAERVKESARTVENLGAQSDQIGEIVGTVNFHT